MEGFPLFRQLLARVSYGEAQMLDKVMFEREVAQCKLAFMQQFHYGSFYCYLKLREQEIRNLMWVSECVAQQQKSRIHDGVVN